MLEVKKLDKNRDNTYNCDEKVLFFWYNSKDKYT